MATIAQIRGMLLEEATLELLRSAGYTPVDTNVDDPTLVEDHKGLHVKGRGEKHQADAVADFRIVPPFSYPQRLVLEAKCYSKNRHVGLPIIRNAVGVYKDICEWWAPIKEEETITTKSRYHYQYALLSTSKYTPEAQRYAFAHDIYLIPYGESAYMSPVVNQIFSLSPADLGARTANRIEVPMKDFRRSVRSAIRGSDEWDNHLLSPEVNLAAQEFAQCVRQIRGSLLAVAGGRFPIYLIPAPGIELHQLGTYYRVRIKFHDSSWYLQDAGTGDRLFSFGLPQELFELYAEHGQLKPEGALSLKEQAFDTLQAILALDNEISFITFQLDMDWIDNVRRDIAEQRSGRR